MLALWEGGFLDLQGRTPGSQEYGFSLIHRGHPCFPFIFLDWEEEGEQA